MAEAKHKHKRLMAWISFGAIVFTLLSVLYFVQWGSNGVADRLAAASPIIIAVLLFLTSLVGAYLGIVHHDDLKNGKHE